MKIKKTKMYLFKSMLEKDSALTVLDDVIGFLDRDDYEITGCNFKYSVKEISK